MKKVITFVLILMLSLTVIAEQIPDGTSIADIFPDRSVAITIRDILGKLSIRATVSQNDLDSITKLAIFPDEDHCVENLEGIQYLHNLEELSIYEGTYIVKERRQYRHKLTEVPDWIGSMQSLKRIDFSGTDISLIPDAICSLQGLEKLYLHGTEITSLPEDIGALSNLEMLDLGGTHITTLPDSIGLLNNLWSLTLTSSDIEFLPDSICDLSNLIELLLSYTPIERLPNDFGKLSKLDSLNIKNTNITELPDSFYNMSIRFLHTDLTFD